MGIRELILAYAEAYGRGLVEQSKSVHSRLLNEISKIEADAERLVWLEKQKSLSLVSDNATWKRENGEKFQTTHMLCAGGTQFAPQPSLRRTIDEAMKVQNG